MSPDQLLIQTVKQVSRETKADDAGVVVTAQGHGLMLRYCIWAIGKNGNVKVEELYEDVTPYERLKAHVEGFVANHLAEFA